MCAGSQDRLRLTDGIAATTDVRNARCGYKQRMFVLPIPHHELKRDTWYYGVRCACAYLLALAEDCLSGNGENHYRSDVPLDVRCECGEVTRTLLLHKFKTP